MVRVIMEMWEESRMTEDEAGKVDLNLKSHMENLDLIIQALESHRRFGRGRTNTFVFWNVD